MNTLILLEYVDAPGAYLHILCDKDYIHYNSSTAVNEIDISFESSAYLLSFIWPSNLKVVDWINDEIVAQQSAQAILKVAKEYYACRSITVTPRVPLCQVLGCSNTLNSYAHMYCNACANQIIASITPLLQKDIDTTIKCECGAEAANCGGHSHWCPKH